MKPATRAQRWSRLGRSRLWFLAVLTTLALVTSAVAAAAGSSKATTGGEGSVARNALAASGSAINAAVKSDMTLPTKLAVTTPLKKRPPIKNIVVINPGVQIEQQVAAGVKGAAAVLGWHYSSISVDQNNPATIVSAMLTAISHGANALVVSATPVAEFESALKVAKQHKVAVIDVASGNRPTSGLTALVNNAAEDGTQFGKPVALAAIEDARKAGQVANAVIVTSPIFATIFGSTDAAMQKAFAHYCAKCSIAVLNISGSNVFSGQTPANVVSYLESHPDVNTILQSSEFTDPGLTAALKGAGLSKVRIYGTVALPEQVASIRSGQESAWVVVPLQVEGWMAVDAAARYFTGDDPATYNSHSIPSYLMTRKNVAAPTEVPVNYKQQFEKMWHVH